MVARLLIEQSEDTTLSPDDHDLNMLKAGEAFVSAGIEGVREHKRNGAIRDLQAAHEILVPLTYSGLRNSHSGQTRTKLSESRTRGRQLLEMSLSECRNASAS